MTKYLTEGLAGTGGRIKDSLQDFLVREIPLYPASGSGTHTFFMIRKEGMTTFQAVERISSELGVHPKSIGIAGIKDANAVSWQVLSVSGIPPERLMQLSLPGISVEWAKPHNHKLRIGHLSGNSFTIKIYGTASGALSSCQEILRVLSERGVPNYYGLQRFGGTHSRSIEVGKAMLVHGPEQFKQLIDAFLGAIPGKEESEDVRALRELYDAGKYNEALRAMPHGLSYERNALSALIESPDDFKRAWMSIPKRLKLFFISALQSHLFNKVLDERITTIDQVFDGEIAMKNDNGACFKVTNQEEESARVKRFEISPTGPIFGYKMLQPEGMQGELERRALASEGIGGLDAFKIGYGLSNKGARRPLRFQLKDTTISESNEGELVLSFTLPSGCYATTVLAEVMKTATKSQ